MPYGRTARAWVFAAVGSVVFTVGAASANELDEVDRVCLLRWVDRAKTNSFKCLACHDGSIASSALHAPAATVRGTHPVEVVYRSRPRNAARLRPRASVPKGLPLVDGKVTCTTCHSGYSNTRGRTAMSMTGSLLCFSCHAY